MKKSKEIKVGGKAHRRMSNHPAHHGKPGSMSKPHKIVTGKKTIKKGKEDFARVSGVAKKLQTEGVSKAQKKELMHSVGHLDPHHNRRGK